MNFAKRNATLEYIFVIPRNPRICVKILKHFYSFGKFLL